MMRRLVFLVCFLLWLPLAFIVLLGGLIYAALAWVVHGRPGHAGSILDRTAALAAAPIDVVAVWAGVGL